MLTQKVYATRKSNVFLCRTIKHDAPAPSPRTQQLPDHFPFVDGSVAGNISICCRASSFRRWKTMKFRDALSGRFPPAGGPISWPPRSPDLMPLDFVSCVTSSMYESTGPLHMFKRYLQRCWRILAEVTYRLDIYDRFIL
jgi:hypothetical protein